jgi:hypothetical protein
VDNKNINKKEKTSDNLINSQSKLFICIGGYPDIEKALLDRKWIKNPDQKR